MGRPQRFNIKAQNQRSKVKFTHKILWALLCVVVFPQRNCFHRVGSVKLSKISLYAETKGLTYSTPNFTFGLAQSNTYHSWDYFTDVCISRCLMSHICDHRSDWNTWTKWFKWVSEYFWKYSLWEQTIPPNSMLRAVLQKVEEMK